MKEIFVLHHIKYDHTVSYPVMLCYKIFTIMRSYFEKHNYIVYDITDFVPTKDEYKQIIDPKKNDTLTDEEIREIYLKAVQSMYSFIRNNDIRDAFIFGFHPYGYDPLFKDAYNYAMLLKHNFKIFMWHDDLHSYNRNRNKPDTDIVSDHRLDKAHYIITPSYNYYRNIQSPYLEKSIFYFYCLNENYFKDILTNDFDKRDNKIILTGASGRGYPFRHAVYQHFHTSDSGKKYIDVLSHPGYDRKKNKGKTGVDYLKILAKYKGAFFGFLSYPLDHPLAKIIEILSCGTIGFFEFLPILEEQLGLIAFVHYVPMLTNNKHEPIFDMKYYMYYLTSPEGKAIAEAGCKYVRERFTMKNKCDEVMNMLEYL